MLLEYNTLYTLPPDSGCRRCWWWQPGSPPFQDESTLAIECGSMWRSDIFTLSQCHSWKTSAMTRIMEKKKRTFTQTYPHRLRIKSQTQKFCVFSKACLHFNFIEYSSLRFIFRQTTIASRLCSTERKEKNRMKGMSLRFLICADYSCAKYSGTFHQLRRICQLYLSSRAFPLSHPVQCSHSWTRKWRVLSMCEHTAKVNVSNVWMRINFESILHSVQFINENNCDEEWMTWAWQSWTHETIDGTFISRSFIH